MSFEELVDRARALAGRGERVLLGIAGAPGSGKSTLARRLVDALGADAALVGMDGFHLAQRELERLGRAERKGAPDTFDVEGYLHLLIRLKTTGQEVVYAPEFRREIEEPVACAVPVDPAVPLVVTEGNYLLVPEGPWARVRPLLDEAWFLLPDERVRLDRLVERHMRYGRSAEQARHRAAHGPDAANAALVNAAQAVPDLVITDLA
ncbi:nucleoside/nucleotide kinase family protein [Saccharothrix coeruleofusca]|uniref:Nucleoside/nucleotide kinase family protein n=1 Tax=Saccharothrix coeruleofusca TaxID=33919 RepID=A0A918AUW8_9PSEU|nr:nucleoside/nucleotide kinase family protein [Saccharothrix coeruleofusca]MBP2339760.1 pantothenate kinase [Saccharothrix coeruleofusca]GGP80350.1 nucleoside/nucleotide kinase family protein [Saccharothrix coeruleofusca]